MSEKTLWGIHAGSSGHADSLFLKKHVIALGWANMGDLSQLSPDREAFKRQLAEAYPETKEGAIPTTAGMLFRLIHEIQEGDLVAYPSKKDRMIHLGRIVGSYKYVPDKLFGYPHRRSVKWLGEVPRTHFSQGALYEIGSALSLFQVKNYADEYIQIIDGTPTPVSDPSADPTTSIVATQIEETAEDFVLKTLAKELKGLQFEDFVSHLLTHMGFFVRKAAVNQPGYDLIASKDKLGFEPPIVKVQVKSVEGSVDDPSVSSLFGKLSPGEFALYVTLGSATKKARNFEETKANLRIIDGSDLVKLIFEHYESFDSRYRSLLPLRRVYVPATIDDAD